MANTPWRRAKLIVPTVLLTLLAVIIYANLRRPEKTLRYLIHIEEPVHSAHFAKILGDLMGPPFLPGNKILSLYNGDEIFPAMLSAIRSARKTITFESYIYWSGHVGDQFVTALSERARAGVKVHVLLDWVGSERIEDSYIQRLHDAGVEVERYHVLKWYNVSRMNNRTHRKILVIDGELGFTGGVGIADEWSGNGLDEKKWRDTHFAVRGPVVAQMQSAFMDNWLKVRPEVHESPEYFPELTAQGDAWAQMFKSSNTEGGSSVRIMYLLAIAAARKSIYLESAYFMPDELVIDEILHARRRGVDVQILVPGKLTDAFVVRHASRRQWEPLLEAGIKFFEYDPAMLHCKVFVVDEYFVSIGSTNFDERSFRLNDEANLNVLSAQFAQEQIRAFEIDKARSHPITLQIWRNRPWKDRIVEELGILFRSQL